MISIERNLEAGRQKNELIKQEITEFKDMIGQNFRTEEAEKIISALDLMIELHSDQEDRLDGRPYISHPLEIASDVIKKYEVKDMEVVIASLLHDAVEDQSLKIFIKRLEREYGAIWQELELKDSKATQVKYKTELSEIALREISFFYGERVKEIVGCLSNPDFDSLIEELKLKGIEKSKNELYKEHVAEAIQNPDACVIKYTDFGRNALTIGNLPEGPKKEKFRLKYGPVIKEVFLPFFHSIAKDHPLFRQKETIIQELEKVYNDQYSKNEESKE